MKSFIHQPLFVALALMLCYGCGSRSSEESVREEQKIREAATAYRDAYMSGFSILAVGEGSTNLSRSSIQSVEKSSNGWLVIFLASHGSNHVESPAQLGQIHVYIKSSGELDRVVRK